MIMISRANDDSSEPAVMMMMMMMMTSPLDQEPGSQAAHPMIGQCRCRCRCRCHSNAIVQTAEDLIRSITVVSGGVVLVL